MPNECWKKKTLNENWNSNHFKEFGFYFWYEHIHSFHVVRLVKLYHGICYVCSVNCTSIFIWTNGFVTGLCIHCTVWFCMTQRSIFDVLEIIYILSVITLSVNIYCIKCVLVSNLNRAQTHNKIHFEDVKAWIYNFHIKYGHCACTVNHIFLVHLHTRAHLHVFV